MKLKVELKDNDNFALDAKRIKLHWKNLFRVCLNQGRKLLFANRRRVTQLFTKMVVLYLNLKAPGLMVAKKNSI